ncbi:hypothetical protein ACFL2V_03615 [Pseudomonadota bacterium]
MTCDGIERRRAMTQQVDGDNVVSFSQRPFISDRELVEQLLKLEREMEREERARKDLLVVSG